MSRSPGTGLGRFEISEHLGVGGKGKVCRRGFLLGTAGAAGLGLSGVFRGMGTAYTAQNKAGTSMDETVHYLSLTEIATRIESKEISPVALTEAMLARIAERDPHLKSYATVMPEQALAEAGQAEREIAAGQYRGPLHGVPVAVKDLCFTKGTRTMGGTKVLADHVPDYDGTAVLRLRAAGAVLLGKLNLTEGAMGGYHPEFEAPVNPWAEDRWTGVSSSGSGVATAAGLCFASLGSDTGGSIRFPAAACGVVGLKPTWGRVSRYGVLALAESLDHVGPLTRRCADAAAVFEVIAGHDPNDPTSLHDPVPNMLEGIGDGIAGLRIGLDEAYIGEGVDEDVSRAVLEAVEVLEGLGARVVEVEMPNLDSVAMTWMTLCSAEAVAAHEAFYPSRSDEYGPWFRGFLDMGARVTGAAYAKAANTRARLNGLLAGVMRRIDVLACPAMPTPPHKIRREQLYGSMAASGGGGPRQLHFTAPFDFSGNPTVTLPCGFTEDGLPLALQLVGHHLGEKLLCRAGHAYESATEWNRKHPRLAPAQVG